MNSSFNLMTSHHWLSRDQLNRDLAQYNLKHGIFHTFSRLSLDCPPPLFPRPFLAFVSVGLMSSRATQSGSHRGKGGNGSFKKAGPRTGSKNTRSVSLDGYLPAATATGSFMNGQFRGSGAEHMQKKKKGLTRKELRKKAKDDRKERSQMHELRKKASKLGVDVEDLKEENSNSKKRKRGEAEEEHVGLIDDMGSDDEELEKKPIKKSVTRAEAQDLRIIKDMEKKLGLTSKGKKNFGDGLDSLFEGIGSDADSAEGSESEGEDDSNSDAAPIVRRPAKPQDIFGKGWKGAEKSTKRDDSSEDASGSAEEDEEDFGGSDVESGSEPDLDDSADMEVDKDLDGEDSQDENGSEDGDVLESGSDFGLGHDDGSTDSEDDGEMFGKGNPYIKHDSDDESDGEEDEEDDAQSDDQSGSDSASEDMPTLVNASSAPKSGAYIPPALRARMASQKGEDPMKAQMLRELRGHVNRLSESNIEAIFELIEAMFSKYPRKSMSDELVRLLVDDCIASVGGATVFTFAPTYAALTMIIHLTLGAEIGGAIVEGCARELQTRIDSNDIAVSRNLLLMFINFYNYNIVHCSMVYDIVRLLIQRMNEQNVDLLLLLIQKCGMSLRKDDPLSTKEIITSVNEITSDWKQSWDNYDASKDVSGENMPPRGKFTKRVQFMIESLNDVKNNKTVSKEADSSTTKMKASIDKYLKKRFKKLPTAESLRISWSDLVGSDHLGRWWAVGSATQIPSDQRAEARKEQQIKQAMKEATILSKKSKDGAPSIDELARAQHMTTATRKAVFSIIVTSEDYVDACEKLTRFDSKDVKPREIVQVILQCCQQEQTWNPFYAHLMEKLCSLDPHFKISLKFLLWEKFDDFSTASNPGDTPDSVAGMSVRALSNCAKLYATLIGLQCLSPTLIKPFPFDQATAKAIVFMRVLLTSLFLEFDTMTIIKQFVAASSSKGYAEFAQAFEMFLQTNLRTLKPEIVKQCRLSRPPYKVADASAVDHVRNGLNALRKAMANINFD